MFDSSDRALPQPLQQHVNFARTLRAIGQNHLFFESNTPLLMLRRRFPIGLAVNLLSRVDLRSRDLSQFRNSKGVRRSLMLITPDHPAPELEDMGAVPILTPASVAEWHLGQDLLGGMHQKWRNRLRHAEAHGLRVTRQIMPQSSDHWLLQADLAQRQARGYRSWPIALTLAYCRANPGAGKLFTAHEGKVPVAGILVLCHGTAATYHIGYTTPRGKSLSAHNLLLHSAAKWLKSKGYERFDLGLIDSVHAPGLARFKLECGAVCRRLGGTWAWWPPLGTALRPLARLDRQSFLA